MWVEKRWKKGFTADEKANRLAGRIAAAPQRKCSDQVYPFPKLFAELVREYLPWRLVREGRVRKSLYTKMVQFTHRGTVAEDTLWYVLGLLKERGISDPRANFLRVVLDSWHVTHSSPISWPHGRDRRSL